MSSIIPGFEYDIFISYRHKDNKGEHWVTEFVNALKTELEATFKEDISIYFDENPHDGLLETYDVDDSLKNKLKCLIFIPIISQTYCDLKSFAWNHEFLAFKLLASDDQFGLKIKLVNGNVSNRILPIKIHDLDADDKTTIESEIGGVLRAIEFIYKEPGVNRPLSSNDSKNDNLNKTDYINQLNKVANAVKEIIAALKNPVSPESHSIATQLLPAKRKSKTLITAILLILILGVVGYWGYMKLSSSPNAEGLLDKSIAVLPFVDMSQNQDQEYFGDGIADEIINTLSQTNNLKVIGRTSSFQFKGKNEDLRKIGEQLGVSTILEGSVRRDKDKMRISAQLIRVIDGSHLWSKSYDRNVADIFAVQAEIAGSVADALMATLLLNPVSAREKKWNEEAYKFYQQGLFFYNRGAKGDPDKAKIYFLKSLDIDSTQAVIWTYLYSLADSNNERSRYMSNAYALDSLLGESIMIRASYFWGRLDFKRADIEIEKIIKSEKLTPRVLRNAGQICISLGRYEEGIELTLRAADLDPLQIWSQFNLGDAYMANGNFTNAISAYKKFMELTLDHEVVYSPLFIAYALSQNIEGAVEISELTKTDQDLGLFYPFVINQIEGNPQKADSILLLLEKQYGNEFPFMLGNLYALKNEKDSAFKWLDKAYEKKDQSLKALLSAPMLIPLRNDPKFKMLKKKLNFP